MNLSPMLSDVFPAATGWVRCVACGGLTIGGFAMGFVVLAVAGAGPAQAAFPGENGRLAFTA